MTTPSSVGGTPGSSGIHSLGGVGGGPPSPPPPPVPAIQLDIPKGISSAEFFSEAVKGKIPVVWPANWPPLPTISPGETPTEEQQKFLKAHAALTQLATFFASKTEPEKQAFLNGTREKPGPMETYYYAKDKKTKYCQNVTLQTAGPPAVSLTKKMYTNREVRPTGKDEQDLTKLRTEISAAKTKRRIGGEHEYQRLQQKLNDKYRDMAGQQKLAAIYISASSQTGLRALKAPRSPEGAVNAVAQKALQQLSFAYSKCLAYSDFEGEGERYQLKPDVHFSVQSNRREQFGELGHFTAEDFRHILGQKLVHFTPQPLKDRGCSLEQLKEARKRDENPLSDYLNRMYRGEVDEAWQAGASKSISENMFEMLSQDAQGQLDALEMLPALPPATEDKIKQMQTKLTKLLEEPEKGLYALNKKILETTDPAAKEMLIEERNIKLIEIDILQEENKAEIAVMRRINKARMDILENLEAGFKAVDQLTKEKTKRLGLEALGTTKFSMPEELQAKWQELKTSYEAVRVDGLDYKGLKEQEAIFTDLAKLNAPGLTDEQRAELLEAGTPLGRTGTDPKTELRDLLITPLSTYEEQLDNIQSQIVPDADLATLKRINKQLEDLYDQIGSIPDKRTALKLNPKYSVEAVEAPIWKEIDKVGKKQPQAMKAIETALAELEELIEDRERHMPVAGRRGSAAGIEEEEFEDVEKPLPAAGRAASAASRPRGEAIEVGDYELGDDDVVEPVVGGDVEDDDAHGGDEIPASGAAAERAGVASARGEVGAEDAVDEDDFVLVDSGYQERLGQYAGSGLPFREWSTAGFTGIPVQNYYGALYKAIDDVILEDLGTVEGRRKIEDAEAVDQYTDLVFEKMHEAFNKLVKGRHNESALKEQFNMDVEKTIEFRIDQARSALPPE